MGNKSGTCLLVLGGTTHANRGDLAMQEGLVRELEKHYPATEIIFYAFNPDETAAALRVNAARSPACSLVTEWNRETPRSHWQRAKAVLRALWFWLQVVVHRLSGITLARDAARRHFLEHLSRARGVFIPGSGAMNSYWWHDWFYPQAFCAVAARLHGVPVILSSQGIGPVFTAPLDRWVARRLFRSASLLGVRDAEQSFAILRSIGAYHENCHHSGDDSLRMAPQRSAAVEAVLASSVPAGAPVMGLNFRDSSTYQKGFPKPANEAFADALARVLQASPGLHGRFVPITYNPQDDDRKPARAVQALLAGKGLEGRVAVVEQEMEAQELRALIGSADFAVGVSYHFLLFCLSSGVPAIGLHANPYYELKTLGLFRLYGMEAWAMDIRSGLEPEALAVRIQEMEARLPELRAQLAARNVELAETSKKFWHLLKLRIN